MWSSMDDETADVGSLRGEEDIQCFLLPSTVVCAVDSMAVIKM